MSQHAPARVGPESTLHRALAEAIDQVASVVVGKERAVRMAFATVLADGHLLIEDLPGVGKTTLAHALALTMGLDLSRVQFTSDLLPSDILGVSIYNRDERRFELHRGAIFAQVVMADEVNRATPKTQSALLEAMAERQVSIDGQTYPLPRPFFVIATQNPSELAGTYPLPDSQLDRFLARQHLGYPEPEAEREILAGEDRRAMLSHLAPQLTADDLLRLQTAATQIYVSDALLSYLQALLAYTRESGQFQHGLSPRAGLALLRCARAWALIDGRDYCMPEDIQTVLPAVATHRLPPAAGIQRPAAELVDELLASVAIP